MIKEQDVFSIAAQYKVLQEEIINKVILNLKDNRFSNTKAIKNFIRLEIDRALWLQNFHHQKVIVAFSDYSSPIMEKSVKQLIGSSETNVNDNLKYIFYIIAKSVMYKDVINIIVEKHHISIDQ